MDIKVIGWEAKDGIPADVLSKVNQLCPDLVHALFNESVARFKAAYTDSSILVVEQELGSEPIEVWQLAGELNRCPTRPAVPPQETLALLTALDISLYAPYVVRDFALASSIPAPCCGTYAFRLQKDMTHYFASLTKKHRSKLKTIWNKNIGDLYSKFDFPEDFSEIEALALEYKDYWVSQGEQGSAAQVDVVLKRFQHPANRDDVVIMQVRESDTHKLVAINFAWLGEENGKRLVYDQMCLRDFSDSSQKRSLGVFCILQMIDWAQRNGVDYYSLSVDPYGSTNYKNVFLPADTSQHLQGYALRYLNAVDVLGMRKFPATYKGKVFNGVTAELLDLLEADPDLPEAFAFAQKINQVPAYFTPETYLVELRRLYGFSGQAH